MRFLFSITAKKNKEITLIYDKPTDDYTINVFDPITQLDNGNLPV